MRAFDILLETDYLILRPTRAEDFDRWAHMELSRGQRGEAAARERPRA